MNKIGEIQLDNEIRIMDAFDFIEQFTVINLSDIAPGWWTAFDDYVENDEDEEYGLNINYFWVVENTYFAKNRDPENYNWQRSEQVIYIEKGVIGIYNSQTIDSENYFADLEDALSSVHQNTRNYIVCSTPFGNDGCFTFDTLKENDNVVAIRINLEEIS